MRRSVLAIVTAAAAALAVPINDARATVAGGQPTSPMVTPAAGSPVSTFTLAFTAREQLGINGVVSTDYRIQIDPPSGARAGCAAVAIAPLTQGMPGQLITLKLQPAAAGGWCPGRYAVAVLLDRGPYCPPSPGGGRAPPCPEFPSQEVDTGDTSFAVGSTASVPPPPPTPAPPSPACLAAKRIVARTGRRLPVLQQRVLRARSPRARRSAKRALLRARAAQRAARRMAAARCSPPS